MTKMLVGSQKSTVKSFCELNLGTMTLQSTGWRVLRSEHHTNRVPHTQALPGFYAVCISVEQCARLFQCVILCVCAYPHNDSQSSQNPLTLNNMSAMKLQETVYICRMWDLNHCLTSRSCSALSLMQRKNLISFVRNLKSNLQKPHPHASVKTALA